MVIARALPVAAALAADRLLGEPPPAVHPVAVYGRSMESLERRIYADSKGAGLAYAGIGVGAAAAAGVIIGARRPKLAVAVATYTAVAGRALQGAARGVGHALARGDIETARRRLPALVGRDPSRLDELEIARATVESVAENTVDAVVAPMVWALAAGAPGALAYRALNTLDAMVGHPTDRYQRFGWASARGDDVAGWLPARLTALLVGVVRPRRSRQVWDAVARQAPAHPSPNAGVAEAAFAAALGIRLGGLNDYAGRIELRPSLGSGRPATVSDIERACALSRDVSVAMAAMFLVPVVWRRLG